MIEFEKYINDLWVFLNIYMFTLNLFFSYVKYFITVSLEPDLPPT